ncbi:E3 ubiquitin ligase family protein [Halapricum desulfuricans]|nr:E3 ubiquitin ligase family protein [Halapricum desulfuricans]
MTVGREALPMALSELLLPGVVAVAGLVVTSLGVRELWFGVRIYRGEPRAVADAANDPGPVEVVGTARPDEGTVEAPFSRAECLVCEWEVTQSEPTGDPDTAGRNWKTLATGLRGGPFRLEDDTASCRVEPSGSVRHLREQTVTVPAGTTPPDEIQAFIASHPDIEPQDETATVGPVEIRLGDEQRYVERRLDPGEDCYVYGSAHYDPSAGSRAGEVNVRIDGDGIRRFLIADSRERGVALEQVQIGLLPTLLGVTLLGAAIALFV